MSAREMPAVREVDTEDRDAMLEGGHQHCHVRLRARVRLYVRMLGSKELLDTIDRGLLDDICKLTSTVITLPRIALGVLVREYRPHRLQDGLGDDILRCNELEAVCLSTNLVVDRFADYRVNFGNV